jgi:hypothetical protein
MSREVNSEFIRARQETEQSEGTEQDGYHFTYEKPEREQDLQQGDVLDKTNKMQSILEKVHPHYLEEKYKHLIILTQSCDLVRRGGGPCSARYITLAPVRPLEAVLERFIARLQRPLDAAAGVCSKAHLDDVRRFLRRLMNNNNWDGYFYLHEDADLEFPYRSCAFLNLPISILAEPCYNDCVEARLLSLKPVFQAKLGWLVGHLYTRVGTPDWVPTIYERNAEFFRYVDDILEQFCDWVDDDKLKAARSRAAPEILRRSEDDIRAFINSIEVKKPQEVVLERIAVALEELSIVIDAEKREMLRNKLKSDSDFSTVVPAE